MQFHTDWIICRAREMDAYCDSDGRPLGEGRVPRERRPPGVPFEMRRCPYQGARAAAQPGQAMNASAMKRLFTTLPETFGCFLYLREQYIHRCRPAKITFIHLWRMGMLTYALPRFLAWRETNRVPDGTLPPYAADTSKMAAGIISLMAEFALREALGDESMLPAVTVKSLMKEADARLVGSGEVCAAPPALIAEALGAFLHGRVGIRTVLPPVASLIGPHDVFFEFAAALMNLQAAQWLLRCAHMCIAERLTTSIKDQKPREKGAHSELASAIQSVSVAFAPRPGGMQIGILDAKRSRRSFLLRQMAFRMMPNSGPARAHLLEALQNAAGRNPAGAPTRGRSQSCIRRRWPQMTESAARRAAATIGACRRFESASLKALSGLESALRSSLGLAPPLRALPLESFDAAIGASRAEGIRLGFGIQPQTHPFCHTGRA